jgi:hypothetical protein
MKVLMSSPKFRLLALCASVTVVLSCAEGSGPFGNGGGGGGGGGTVVNPNAPDTTRPFTIIDTPVVGQLVNAGDSIYVSARIHDERALASVTFTGFKVTGNVNLGNLQRTIRYNTEQSPLGGESFPANLNDTTIRRYLKPAVPIDTTPDSAMVLMAVTTDAAGNVDTTIRLVNIVTGPRVSIISPLTGDSVPQGVAMAVSVTATQTSGIDSLIIKVKGDTGFTGAARLDTTIIRKYAGVQASVTLDTSVLVPLVAPIRGKITISARATDKNRNPGKANDVVVTVRAQGTTIPHVVHDVDARIETTDSITVSATGDGIEWLGYVMKDLNGVLITRDSFHMTAPFTSNARRAIQLLANLTVAQRDSQQGKTVHITSFAIDQSGTHGFSVPSVASPAQSDSTLAFSTEAIVVFGHTFPLPRPGVVGDISVDDARGHVFVSNLSFNRLEVFQSTTNSFFAAGIPVGSQPWGLNRSATSVDSMLVANSGGTNVSKVFIGAANPANMSEDTQHRIRTRVAPLWLVEEKLNTNTGTVNFVVHDPILFSNRPQYVGQITDGAAYSPVFFSTRPTSEATRGIIHWFDPSQTYPDLHTIISYTTSTTANYLLMDLDSVIVHAAVSGSNQNDTLFLCDHAPGTLSVGSCISNASGVGSSMVAIRAAVGSDVYAIPNVDEGSIGLTDTTFVAVSGDRNWIAFGSGNTAKAGNVFMSAANPSYFSPILTQEDLTNNAAEHIFGLALDSTGATVGAHGAESYFASVENPFHLRLQGSYSTFATGAGIAFHPAERGFDITPPAQRLAFVASDNLTIEVLDVAHFLNAGSLPTKGKLYGPLRVTRKFPGDPANVVLKLYGVTTEGLVIIDVRDANITPVPIRAP